jgi:hypothetical protein
MDVSDASYYILLHKIDYYALFPGMTLVFGKFLSLYNYTMEGSPLEIEELMFLKVRLG